MTRPDPYEGAADKAVVWAIFAILLNFLFIPSIFAIMYGVQARRSINSKVHSRGSLGVGLGIAGAVITLVLFIAIVTSA